jgi:hypothetical protein
VQEEIQIPMLPEESPNPVLDLDSEIHGDAEEPLIGGGEEQAVTSSQRRYMFAGVGALVLGLAIFGLCLKSLLFNAAFF